MWELFPGPERTWARTSSCRLTSAGCGAGLRSKRWIRLVSERVRAIRPPLPRTDLVEPHLLRHVLGACPALRSGD